MRRFDRAAVLLTAVSARRKLSYVTGRNLHEFVHRLSRGSESMKWNEEYCGSHFYAHQTLFIRKILTSLWRERIEGVPAPPLTPRHLYFLPANHRTPKRSQRRPQLESIRYRLPRRESSVAALAASGEQFPLDHPW
jgi:hypothetical protein